MNAAVVVLLGTLVLITPLGRTVYAQPAAPAHRLEGDWVRIDPDGAGSFGGLGASISPAQLLPGVGGGRGGVAAAAGAADAARRRPVRRPAPTLKVCRTS